MGVAKADLTSFIGQTLVGQCTLYTIRLLHECLCITALRLISMAKGKQIMMSSNTCDECGDSMSSGNGIVDRSKVRILLCESNAESQEEISSLLSKCCYQVIEVSSGVQIIEALTAEGPYIDIILVEVELIMGKGVKILNYITRDKNLQHIAVILLLTQDRLALMHNGLLFGAADYLIKPLDADELLNLWMHAKRKQSFID